MIIYIRRCPQCGDRSIVMRVDRLTQDEPDYWIECLTCKFAGPKNSDMTEAKVAWNKLRLKDFN